MEYEFIGLGSNCSICYQLNKYNLRKQAYPFDWVKLNLNELIDILDNNFINYYETIEFKKKSEIHKLVNDNILTESSLILSNCYKIQFAHELNNIDKIDEFKKKIINRIERFLEIKNSNKNYIFIRIELGKIKLNWENKIFKLIKLLNKFINKFTLKLIINSKKKFNFPDFVEIYRFEKFDSDWQMNNINWQEIFNIQKNNILMT